MKGDLLIQKRIDEENDRKVIIDSFLQQISGAVQIQ